ncbi:hypothetical protein Tco_0447388, partial [Tanacetum coccineum]
LARLVPHLVTPESRMIERYAYGLAPQICGIMAATEPKAIQKAMRNGSIKKVKKRGNIGEPSKDKNGRDDNKRTRTRNAFATICTICNSYHAPREEERIRVLGPSVPSATPTMHPERLVAHALTVTTRVIWQWIVEA